jgi:hypothetical protein
VSENKYKTENAEVVDLSQYKSDLEIPAKKVDLSHLLGKSQSCRRFCSISTDGMKLLTEQNVSLTAAWLVLLTAAHDRMVTTKDRSLPLSTATRELAGLSRSGVNRAVAQIEQRLAGYVVVLRKPGCARRLALTHKGAEVFHP